MQELHALLMNRVKSLYKDEKYLELLKNVDELILLDPNNISAIRMKAWACYKLERYDEAIDILQKAIVWVPDNTYLYLDICDCYHNVGDVEAALHYCIEGLKRDSNNLELLKTYAATMRFLGNGEGAIEVVKRALILAPNDMGLLMALGRAYYSIGMIEMAIRCYEEAYKVNPNDAEPLLLLCAVMGIYAEGDEADNLAKSYRYAQKLLAVAPSKIEAANSVQEVLLKVLDYDLYFKFGNRSELVTEFSKKKSIKQLVLSMARVVTMQDRWELLEAHRTWGAEQQKLKKSASYNPRQRLNNKIRIGIASSDFRDTHVGRFMMPLIDYLEQDKFEIYCYAIGEQESFIRGEAVKKAHQFSSYRTDEADNAIIESIHADRLDVLVEVGMMFVKPRLLAQKLAPLMISWLDYPHSTGLPIDYLVVDPYIKPEEGMLLEKPLIMPETWVAFDPKRFGLPEVSPNIPEDQNKYLTLGTMNAAFKLNYETFRVWAGIMQMLPNSRFLYVRPESVSPILQHNFCEYMQQYGIDSTRISFVSTRHNHMKYYNDIDIALDVFPHTGGTTTCEALWMGVPVVTLVGPAFFERISYSNLNNSGLSELCAFSIKEYQQIVYDLAQNKEKRRYLKRNLRQQMMLYPLAQPCQFAKGFGDMVIGIS